MDEAIFTHYLGGNQVTEPFGFRAFTEELDRDVKERLISVKYQAQLIFKDDGYKVLNDLFLSNGFCSTISYEAKQECDGVMRTCCKGEIIIADCEFNETACDVKCSIADDGVGARIVNNKGTPASPTAASTKNDFPLTPLTPLALTVFRPSDGNDYPDPRRAWDWYDAIKNAVLYITDNTVTISSAWYEALPDGETYAILDGNELRVHDASNPRFVYSFGRLFRELAIKYDLWIAVGRDVLGNPVLRMEPQSTFFGTTGTVIQANIQDLIRSVDDTLLYGKVSVGSETYIKALQTGAFSLPFLVLRGFTKEEFGFKGVCNTDDTLDLVNEWIIDSNVIEDVLVNNNDEYDDDTFIIQYRKSDHHASDGDYLNPTNLPVLYNEQLQNMLVLDRYDLPSDVGTFYSPIDASFQAENTIANTVYVETAHAATVIGGFQIQYDNDYTAPNFDTTNNWGNGTVQGNSVSQADSRYTAPVQGYYVISTEVDWRISSNVPFIPFLNLFTYKQVQLSITLRHFNAGNVDLGGSIVVTSGYQYGVANYSLSTGQGFSMDVGDYVWAQYQFEVTDYQTIPGNPLITAGLTPGVTFNLVNGTFIRTYFVAGGGFLAGGDVSRLLKYEYERHVSLEDWVSLTLAPENILTIGGGEIADVPVHVLNAKRNVATGATKWETIRRPD